MSHNLSRYFLSFSRKQDAELVQAAWNTSHTELGLDGFSPQDDLVNIDPLHLNISMHTLHTVPNAFHKVLTRRICLAIKSLYSW